MTDIRLTAAQALIRYLCAQRSVVDGVEMPLFAGVFAIFGHGNVAGLGDALDAARDSLPTFRAHNEQAMAHAAIAFAKAHAKAKDDGLQHLDRARGHKSGNGCCPRPRKSLTGPAAARRHIC